MTELTCKQVRRIDEYWLVYAKDDGSEGHIQLSACANNFSIHRGGEPGTIGLRYEKDGFGCYELFNVGHTLIKCPLKPKLFGSAAKLREKYEGIEKRLNEFGWKTLQK